MASAIPTLWSDDIKVDVVSPAAILRAQVAPLRALTKGILEAEITTESSDSGMERLHFELVAPLLDNYHHRILSATYARNMVYPVTLEAECFRPHKQSYGESLAALALAVHQRGVTESDWRPKAATEQEFIELIGQVLRSSEVRAIIHSLIARSNDQGNGSSRSSAEASS
ncbi:MAG: hypothetical protein P4L84_23395 [Isosphaeraceae bacterium]|nr:hypothetical protein [Isosphaeraceae bacterium]